MQPIAHPKDAPVSRDLPQCGANHEALSPLSFLQRSAVVYAELPACVYGEQRLTWAEMGSEAKRFAAALHARQVQPGQIVSMMAHNTPELFLAHFAVPLAGAVLNAINTRLEANTLAYILQHAESTVLIYDSVFRAQVMAAIELLETDKPLLIEFHDQQASEHSAPPSGVLSYVEWLAEASDDFEGYLPADEWQAISVNYTSGTTGKPKGVVYSHRGAHQLAMGNVLAWDMPHHSKYLWTLPMFHCNGWCFPWTLAAIGGTSICLREVRAEPIFHAIQSEGASHLCGAPFVLDLLASAVAGGQRLPEGREIKVMTAAAPPTAATLRAVEDAGFDVTHVYGLTEIYGPAVVCSWKPSWDALPADERVQLKSRQGVAYHVQAGLMVAHAETMAPVPWDGATLGEVMTRGNATMMGYLKNPEATEAAFAGGWFHTGDLGVCYPDGYIQLKDRAKDIIISGGENISSIEVEDALCAHPAVALAAVVAQACDRWGERPYAFVELHAEQHVSEQALIEFCRERLAGFKCPDRIAFGELPKTATGKIPKFQLRKVAAQDKGSF